MTWQEIRRAVPHRWILVEALKAHSESAMRVVEDLSIIGEFHDSVSAMREYQARHRADPARELYVVHTDREELDIHERVYVGPRYR
jgi:hypothetical protein